MKRLTYRLEDQYGNPTDSIILESDLLSLNSSEKWKKVLSRLAAIEDILGDEYELDRLRELVELYSNVPHICDYCIGCEIEPADGHGCDGIYDNFVFSIRRIVAALKAREQDGNNK